LKVLTLSTCVTCASLLAGKETGAQRAERHEVNAELLEHWQKLCFRSPPEQRILTLDCRHGLDGMYTTDRLHACFRQTEVLDLAFGDQLLDGTSHIFDRHFRINAVLVEDVDTIGPQTI
jgi:hypothetical protein